MFYLFSSVHSLKNNSYIVLITSRLSFCINLFVKSVQSQNDKVIPVKSDKSLIFIFEYFDI